MSRARRVHAPWSFALALSLVQAAACPTAWALQRTVKVKVHNYPNTPVEVKRARVTLTQTFATPTQTGQPGAGARRSQVRYANRAGLTASGFVLSGETTCVNRSSQTVEAFALTVVALDAFHQPVHLPGEREGFAVKQIVQPLSRGSTADVSWEQPVASDAVYEVAVVVTRVRFADGSTWFAPGEELIDVF